MKSFVITLISFMTITSSSLAWAAATDPCRKVAKKAAVKHMKSQDEFTKPHSKFHATAVIKSASVVRSSPTDKLIEVDIDFGWKADENGVNDISGYCEVEVERKDDKCEAKFVTCDFS
jgi:hypothetical protein